MQELERNTTTYIIGGIIILILTSTRNSPMAWDLRVFLREKLLEFIQKEYPQFLPKSRIRIDRDREYHS